MHKSKPIKSYKLLFFVANYPITKMMRKLDMCAKDKLFGAWIGLTAKTEEINFTKRIIKDLKKDFPVIFINGEIVYRDKKISEVSNGQNFVRLKQMKEGNLDEESKK